MLYWLASYPKSGNTWVRKVLQSYLEDRPVGVNDLSPFVFSDRGKAALQAVSSVPIDELTIYQRMALRPAMLLHLDRSMYGLGCPKVVKTHSACSAINDIPLVPRGLCAGVIYVVRDPRDVAISYAEHVGKDIDTAIDQMAERKNCFGDGEPSWFVNTWSNHVYSWLHKAPADDGLRPAYDVKAVRYEDLVEDPATHFRQLVQRLPVKFSEERLQTALESGRFDRLQQQEAEHGFRERVRQDRFFARGTAGHWYTQLSTQQIARIQRDHGEMMQALGYTLISTRSRVKEVA